MKINLHKARSQLSRLGKMVWLGEKVIITKAGKPYLDLIPHKPGMKTRTPGRYKDQIKIAADFYNTPTELNKSFESDL